ncbi:TolC family protein [Marilutibacter maris]|uniref:Putative outer membrane efflux protein n=1 Tax=Marilutibacter maris TaxID=1605891 RepID=A0A2U9T5D8_9GAMM|nr:TolC family protein [Lysobacter maris]AWV06184.1 putative outer membrane efflux protein [Lysobacter maris]
MTRLLSPSRRHGVHRWPVSMLVLAFALVPAASIASGITYEDALRNAVERAPSIQARQSRIQARQARAARAAALPDPELKLGISNLPVTGANAFDTGADMMTMKQVGLMQAFPARAKRRARQAVAERLLDQARALSLAERLEVRRATAQAWIELWAAQHEVAALQALREPADVAVRAAKARTAGGSGMVSDALAAQAGALDLENRIDAAQARLEAARAGLARWLDEAPEALRAEGKPPSADTLPVAPAALLASIDRHGALLPWRAREAVAAAEVDAAIAGKRPDWSLGFSYGQRERTPAGRPRSDMLMVEFAIDLPLFTGNRQERDIAASRAELDAAGAERDDARRLQAERLQRHLALWQGLKRRLARIEDASLPLARDRSRTALAAYGAGGGLQPWLDARRGEVELLIEHARRRGELGRVWADLAYLLPENLLPENQLPEDQLPEIQNPDSQPPEQEPLP